MPVDLKNLHNKEAYLMITSSQDTDMYYATRFWAPDPFIYIATRRKSMMLMSDLEIDRAKKEARVDKVYSISKLKKAVERLINKKSMPDAVDYAAYVLNKEHIKRIIVPSNFPTRYTFDMTDRYRFKLICKKDPFFTERVCKAEDEIRCLKKATADTEEILQAVIEMIRDSKVKKGKLYKNGELLTSERINSFIAISALKKHYAGSTSIVACGKEGCDPHNYGHGPIWANKPIILDLFPRSLETNYYADMTRTIVKGRASEKVRNMFRSVLKAFNNVLSKIREGVTGDELHNISKKTFEEDGFKTGNIDGRMQGFFHGTGHGLGLALHELPRISQGGAALVAGTVITIEPALYYSDVGGVRLEDAVVVTKNGYRNLNSLPKFLEVS